jgi:hypothetical protein
MSTIPHRKQGSILGLAPVPQQQESTSLAFNDPFVGVYRWLSKDERRVVDECRKQALVTRAQEVKAVLAVRAIGELVEETTVEFTQTALALDPIKTVARGTESAAYVEEFVHRQKQLLACHLEDVLNIGVYGIKAEVGRTLYPPSDRDQERSLPERLFGIWR